MHSITDLLAQIAHRPWELPKGNWKYYQEWNNALFIHWAVPPEALQHYLPENLPLDTFEGKAYVSLVAFTMQKIRPRQLPAVAYISDFHEINLRTYIDRDGKKGVYFLSMEAEKSLSVWIAKSMSGLPYEKALMFRDEKSYTSKNAKRDFELDAVFEIKETVATKTDLDRWLTERYSLYLDEKNSLYRYEVHHKEWEIKHVEVKNLNLKYKIGDLDFSKQKPDLMHYSDGVKVLAWGREKLK
ncbi:YqjF family protein [Flavobacterium soli]|uniref:YqjF family protein n=1 Tax=Flavobacterium soli TaxID=344881 RepID=UPI0003FF4E44|nr:DUF2071 domain-containing protein [Flavobacterium soli]